MTWLLRLYPPRWRRRYGRELTELVAEQPFSIAAAADLLAGAIDAWLHPQLVASDTHDSKGAVPMMARSMSGGLFSSVLLGIAAFIAIYLSLVAAEWASVGPLGSYLRDDLSLSVFLRRIAILSVTVLPAAYFTGLVMARLAPNQSARAALYAASLFALAISVLQVTVYDVSVIPASILKVLFATAPLLLASANRRSDREVS